MTTTLGPPRNPVPRAVVEQSATNRGGGSPTEEPAEVNPARQRGNWTLQLTRGAAVLTTFAIGGASFLLSFKSLNDLASRAALWSDVAWLWPLTVDMTIVSATMAIVALAGYADQGRNRKFFWALLVCAAMISVGGNALHALLPRDTPLNPWLSAGIAMVPPLLLLATTHGLAVLWRFRPARPAEIAAALTAERVNKWEAVAALLVERGKTPLAVDKVADILRSVHDLGMSHRKIGLQHNVHHGTVGALKNASLEVLQSLPLSAAPAER